MDSVLYQSILVFLSQLAFLWARTSNIHATAKNDLKKVLLTGSAIHILWLVSIALGANGVKKVMIENDLTYLPVILFSLIGSLIGAYIGVKNNQKK